MNNHLRWGFRGADDFLSEHDFTFWGSVITVSKPAISFAGTRQLQSGSAQIEDAAAVTANEILSGKIAAAAVSPKQFPGRG